MNEIKLINYTGEINFNNWVENVASSGTIYYDGPTTTEGISAIPTGWTIKKSNYLTFTAKEANSTISMKKVGSPNDVSLEYSTDGNTWNDFVVGSTNIILSNVDDKAYVRAKNTNPAFGALDNTHNKFVTSGLLDLSGNIMSLIDKYSDEDTTVPYCAFCNLFNGTKLYDISQLTFPTKTSESCYRDMFNGCTRLINAGTTLPSLSVSSWAYGGMFSGCYYMTKAPIMYGTSYGGSAVAYMFYNCHNLNEIVFKNYSGYIYGTQWVYNVASSGTIYYDGPTTNQSVNEIPVGWIVKPCSSYGIKGVIFQAKQANSTISMTKVGDAPDISLDYTYDGETWYEFIVGETTITLENVGDVVGIRCNWGGNS